MHCFIFVQGLTCLQKARELNPISSLTLFNLALVYASLRQYCSAVIYWRAALNSDPGDTEIVRLITTCLTKLNDSAENPVQ